MLSAVNLRQYSMVKDLMRKKKARILYKAITQLQKVLFYDSTLHKKQENILKDLSLFDDKTQRTISEMQEKVLDLIQIYVDHYQDKPKNNGAKK